MAYDNDLREKVVQYVKCGHSKYAAARFFKLARNTVLSWLKMSEAGDLTPKRRGPKQGKRIVDRAKVAEYVDNNPDKTLVEIGKVFQVSHHSIWKILRKELGYVHKKKSQRVKKPLADSIKDS